MPNKELKYCEYFNVNEKYFPCIDESAINSGVSWQATYPHEAFISLLNGAEKMLGGITNKSLWIHGAYGTGKSQCAYALKKILEAPEAEVRAYWDQYEALSKNKVLLEKLIGHKEQGIVTAYRYASGSISTPQQLFMAVQESIAKAIAERDLDKGDGTLKESVIAWMEDPINNNMINSLLQQPEWESLFSQSTADEIINSLRKSSDVSSLMDNIFKLAATLIERKAILSWVSNYGWIEEINHIYPALADYMKKYVFSTTVLQQELTDYFEEYKKQKITNKINPQFLEIVNDNAKSYKYAKLPTRNSVINGIKDKNSVHLHWVDALGVEYLSFITEIARKKGISLQVEIARADLPTITVINKSFYDNWTGKSKEKEERLDEIKHKQQGGYLFTDSKEPIHLAAELGIIEEVMQKAETSLAMRECSKFVIASDHGASRLAVIKEQEVKYETDTKGEHSGRCCKYFDGCDLEYCIPENEYLVLSDYGRFKGSRKANVEVHGGATWEEIIVPIITLSLKNQEEVEIKVLDADNIFIEKNKGVLVKVYISDTSGANEVAIVCEGKKYIGQKEDATHYNFCISGIKRAKKYKATVYNGDDLIGEIEFTAKSKTGSVNTEFDDLF